MKTLKISAKPQTPPLLPASMSGSGKRGPGDEVPETPIDIYLQEISHHLTGSLPEKDEEALLYEARFWLERQTRDFILEGKTQEGAEREAVRISPKPKQVAEDLLQDYFESTISSPVSDRLGRANSVAGAIFGIANVLYLIFLQMRVYLPATGPIVSDITPGEARSLFPEPLPNPDFTWQFFVTIGYPLIAPIVCGWVCGDSYPWAQ